MATQSYTIRPLATLQPPSNSRTWQSCPHPSLPLVATACSDKSVRVYSLSSFNLESTVTGGHKRSVRAVAWKPGTRKGEAILATGSFDASAGIWRKDYRNDGASNAVNGVASLEEDDDEEEEDEDEYVFTILLDGHESEIKSLAFSGSSRFLATCSRDKSVWIWEELEDDNWETVAVLQEHDGDVKCVAWHPAEDLLTSASYDDTIRLYKEDIDDWIQVGVLMGHEQTVWWVTFESLGLPGLTQDKSERMSQEQQDSTIQRKAAGPRLLSCSDDLTIRIWQRVVKDPDAPTSRNTGIPSIIRSNDVEEEWVEEVRLPQSHDRSIYSVSWSQTSGRIVSAGSDGKIVVYEERWKASSSDTNGMGGGSSSHMEVAADNSTGEGRSAPPALTEWVVVAEVEGAHSVYEVNHVCWSKRWDKGRKNENEEVIISTGDEGEVKVWTLEQG